MKKSKARAGATFALLSGLILLAPQPDRLTLSGLHKSVHSALEEDSPDYMQQACETGARLDPLVRALTPESHACARHAAEHSSGFNLDGAHPSKTITNWEPRSIHYDRPNGRAHTR